MKRSIKLYDFEDFNSADKIVIEVDGDAKTWHSLPGTNVELSVDGGPVDGIFININCYTPQREALFILVDLDLSSAGNKGQVDWVGLPAGRKVGVCETL